MNIQPLRGLGVKIALRIKGVRENSEKQEIMYNAGVVEPFQGSGCYRVLLAPGDETSPRSFHYPGL